MFEHVRIVHCVRLWLWALFFIFTAAASSVTIYVILKYNWEFLKHMRSVTFIKRTKTDKKKYINSWKEAEDKTRSLTSLGIRLLYISRRGRGNPIWDWSYSRLIPVKREFFPVTIAWFGVKLWVSVTRLKTIMIVDRAEIKSNWIESLKKKSSDKQQFIISTVVLWIKKQGHNQNANGVHILKSKI